MAYGVHTAKPHHVKETCQKLHGKPQGIGWNGGFKSGW